MNTIHVAAEKHAALISCDVNASWPWNIAVSGFQMHVMDQANLIFSFNQCNLSLYFVGSAVSRFQNNVRAILKIPHHQGLTFENRTNRGGTSLKMCPRRGSTFSRNRSSKRRLWKSFFIYFSDSRSYSRRYPAL